MIHRHKRSALADFHRALAADRGWDLDEFAEKVRQGALEAQKAAAKPSAPVDADYVKALLYGRKPLTHRWHVMVAKAAGISVTDYERRIAALSPSQRELDTRPDWIRPGAVLEIRADRVPVPASGLLAIPPSINAIEGSSSRLAEGAWPLHQTLEKPLLEIAHAVEEALDRGNLDFALPEFRRILFYTGYHEEWAIRRHLTTKLLQAPLGPRDAAWVRLKSEAYMEIEMRHFSRAKAAIDHSIDLYKRARSSQGGGECLRYLGDLHAKFGNVPEAIRHMKEALRYLEGITAHAAELELRLLHLQYATDPSPGALKEAAELAERFRELKSWRYWVTELQRSKLLRDLGEQQDALTLARYVELGLRTELTMERTRRLAVRLIEDIEGAPLTRL